MNFLYFVGWSFFRLTSRFVFRVKVSGLQNVPASGGFILASNHISYFDPPLLGSCLKRDMYFFAKEELFNRKLFGAVLRQVNSLPVKRGIFDRRALETAINIVRNGNGLVFFPEGTRSKNGQLMSPKIGVGVIARQAVCPIIPAFISGADTLKKSLTDRRKLFVKFGEPLTVEWIKSFPAVKDSYREIALTVMSRIADLREELYINQNIPRAGHTLDK